MRCQAALPAPAQDDAPAPPAPPRFYTPRECARLQGFPEAFVIPASARDRNPGDRFYRYLKGSVGEGPNHSNFSEQSSANIVSESRKLC